MTLAFKQHINGSPTYFVEKIWASIKDHEITKELSDYLHSPYSSGKNILNFNPKYHTIREDSKNRWKPGNKIHFVINNRTKNRLQFAPVIYVKSTQTFEISRPVWSENLNDAVVKIDGRVLSLEETQNLAWNDGFANLLTFWIYFNKDFKGKIIHWTDLKY